MTALVLVAIAVLGVLFALGARRTVKRRRAEAKTVASELIPEIRAILASSDSGGEPVPVRAFAESRRRLPRLLGEETLFAVETFYEAVEAYRDASQWMRDAFSDASDSSLGDRIRAKDRRDRSRKDVFYAGEAAIERLARGVDS